MTKSKKKILFLTQFGSGVGLFLDLLFMFRPPGKFYIIVIIKFSSKQGPTGSSREGGRGQTCHATRILFIYKFKGSYPTVILYGSGSLRTLVGPYRDTS